MVGLSLLTSGVLVFAHLSSFSFQPTTDLEPIMLSQALRLKLPSRLFSSTISSLEKSSVPAGTVLNLKIRKNGDEPVALEDSEYPEWLWECLDKEKQEQRLKEQDFMKWRKKQINKANTAKIKNNNFISQM